MGCMPRITARWVSGQFMHQDVMRDGLRGNLHMLNASEAQSGQQQYDAAFVGTFEMKPSL